MAAQQEECEVCEPGAPGWIVTFSDLMSLLLTFFVLLLSFADMEVKRFRQVAASLKEALGVQRDYVAEQLPMGTSVVKKEFTPGKQDQIDFENIDHRFTVDPSETREMERIATQQQEKDDLEEAKKNEQQIKELLKEDIKKGNIEVARDGTSIILRIREKATFKSGSSTLQKRFLPLLLKISKTLKGLKGQVDIVGHTDNIPISTNRFRSNWELSTSRAVSVAHALLKVSKINPKRVTIMGKGEMSPVASNDTVYERARNRRVEVVVRKSKTRKPSSY